MKIIVNDEPQALPEGATVREMCQVLLGTEPDGVAVAVNADVVPRSKWAEFILHENDSVMLVTATQGG